MTNRVRSVIIAAALASMFAGAALANRLPLLGVGGGGPPPGCSFSLDFSDGCNSGYVGAKII